ncbi:MAG: hypothetical protein ABSA45_01410 [Verrucomicrobiota bacterium]|jgi:hypothetical protein
MLNKKTGLIALLVGFAAGEIMAGDFSTSSSYNVGDVLVCFRQGGNDLVVDAGPISTYTGGSPNQRIPITLYTGTQLSRLGTNSVSWSAFAWLSDNTLFMTRARSSLNVQTAPWLEYIGSAQAGTIGQTVTIPKGAYDEYGLNHVYPESTATAVVEEDGSSGNPNYGIGAASYHEALAGEYGTYNNFDGKFQGNPENTTLSTFTASGRVVRSDFYQLTPASGYPAGTWLGYFELSTNGAMTFVSKPSTTPSIISISRAGNTSTITYTAGVYGTYTLHGTNNIAAPVSTWPAIATLASGDTATHTVMDTTTDSARFYIISAQ